MREFEAFTADLYRLADWLSECGVETVVMESTGVYWIPLFGVLEERGVEVMLVDPRRIKNVPGRKTDVRDCQWLQQLHTYGLLSGAFRPEAEIRRLRSYLRQRAMLVEYASQQIQHMQKALTQMNVKLQHVISDIAGRTGTDITWAIAGGERNPRKLARLRDPRIKADAATIARSLRGHWREEHIFELTQALELYRFYQDKIAECDQEIEAQLERFEDRSDGEPPAPNGKKRNQKNAPRFDAQGQLYRMTGVDLTRIDGVDAYTALKVVSEIGTGMTKWPSAKHFASWLGLSPNNRITGASPNRRRGCVHSPEGGQRDWHRHDEMAQRQALRVLAGAEPQQPHHRRITDGRVISSKTKPSANRAAPRPCVWRPTRCTTPTAPWAPSCAGRKPNWARLKPSPPPPTSWPGSSTPCCGTDRSTWMLARNTTNGSISSGRCAPRLAGRPNWATNWCPCPMPNLRTCPTDQRPRPRDRFRLVHNSIPNPCRSFPVTSQLSPA